MAPHVRIRFSANLFKSYAQVLTLIQKNGFRVVEIDVDDMAVVPLITPARPKCAPEGYVASRSDGLNFVEADHGFPVGSMMYLLTTGFAISTPKDFDVIPGDRPTLALPSPTGMHAYLRPTRWAVCYVLVLLVLLRFHLVQATPGWREIVRTCVSFRIPPGSG